MDANGIPEVAPGAVGIHLSWSGPRSWVYSPTGFTVQRRRAGRREARECERLDAAAIATLRLVRERLLPFGVLTLLPGRWLEPLTGPAPVVDTPTDTFHLDLHADHRLVRVTVTAKLSFLVARCDGRVVGVDGPRSGAVTHIVRAPRIDTATIVTLDPAALQVCVDGVGDDAEDWKDVPALVSGLTLPFRELMPSLTGPADELAEARGRLLPGEALGAEEFERLAAVVRPTLRAAGPPRPAELAMLLRAEPDTDPEEVRALDPLRVLPAHPTWRRALGFALFDDDPALVAGESYEYRVSATFPGEDVRDANHGFATVPSGTLLPTDFSLDGVRLRLPRPVVVGLAPGTPPDGLVRVTRRGIPLDPRRESHWLTPSLDDWSLVVDFPEPVDAVVLELADGHDLEFAAGPAAGAFGVTVPVPAGTAPRLVFGSPSDQVRLRGTGFLHALRASTPGDDKATVAVVLPPILLADTALPPAPLAAAAANLQAAVPAPTGPVPAAEVAPRHALGFTVSWRPAPAFGVTAWSTDLDAAPPLDATIFQVERRAEPAGDWTPVLGEDNWTLGDRDGGTRALDLTPGCEVMEAFPETAGRPAGTTLDLTLVDTFDEDGAPEPPAPGTLLRYRVRAVDAVGRPSPNWTETAPVRLEKHLPPPVPVEVEARVLVRDAPDLTTAERQLLGTSGNAVVLRWGWHTAQREQDPRAHEFRMYAAAPLDAVPAHLRTRPPAWVPRATVVPAGAATAYEAVLRDRLLLNPDHPTDTLWVGVSCADAEDYVPDQLAPLDTRPGNESAIVPALATGRWHGQPTLEIPPPLADVPELRTPEPGAEPIHFPLDLTPFLPAPALATGRVRHERVAAATLLAACRATADGRVMAMPVEPLAPGDAEVEIAVPNPADRAELVAALGGRRRSAVADRFLVFIAGHHPYRDRLFASAHDAPLPPGAFPETLAPNPARWLYRVRAADAAGHVSVGSATARVVVRVPSTQPGPPPQRLPSQPGDAPAVVRVHVPEDPALTHLLLFHAPSTGAGPVPTAAVLRVPNRPDLPPGGGLWLRAPDGGLLAPTAIALDDPAAVPAAAGGVELPVTIPGGPGDRTRIWLATLTRDGIPSRLTGPYTVLLPVVV